MKWITNLFFKQVEPENLKFKIGQKVFCCITHEVRGSKVCNGVIKGWAYKKKSYWAFSDIPSDWYRVQYENGQIKTLPEERLEDLNEYITHTESFFKFWDKRPTKTDQRAARERLEYDLAKAKEFNQC